jgi:hypothetical protein
MEFLEPLFDLLFIFIVVGPIFLVIAWMGRAIWRQGWRPLIIVMTAFGWQRLKMRLLHVRNDEPPN